jgi:hypothetical protein
MSQGGGHEERVVPVGDTPGVDPSSGVYLANLEWMKKLGALSEPERKVLLALSHSKYQWRTRDRLVSVTGLSPAELDSILAGLIAKEFVRPSFSKNKNIIFGLRERVDRPQRNHS